jgi:hypothetical protein
MPRNHDLRDQRIGLTEENLSGGEQDTSEGIPVTPKGKPANGGLRDNTKSAFLIAILIVAFGVLAIAAIAITAAAFSNAPPGRRRTPRPPLARTTPPTTWKSFRGHSETTRTGSSGKSTTTAAACGAHVRRRRSPASR